MASIGAKVEKARFGNEENGEEKDVLYFTEQRLMEWSIVSIGSNPDAQKRNSQTVEELRVAAAPIIDVVEVSRSVQEAQMIINKNK